MPVSFPVAMLVGAGLGFLSGLGIGGGSLLILWLTIAAGMDAAAARSVNLLFFIPSALVACLLRRRQGLLKHRVILPAAFAGCASAAIFSVFAAHTESAVLRKLFGCILLFTGAREILWRDEPRSPPLRDPGTK